MQLVQLGNESSTLLIAAIASSVMLSPAFAELEQPVSKCNIDCFATSLSFIIFISQFQIS